MKMVRPLQALACLALWSLPASAIDLRTIDRRIAKEPAYRTKTPKYGLLVFGPGARHRVWLVVDGDTLYVDRNGNGDLTEENECVQAPAFKASTHPVHAQERSIEIGTIACGDLTHTNLTVSQTRYRRKVDVTAGAGASTPQEWQGYLDSIWRQLPDGIGYLVSIQLDPRCYGLFGDTKGQRVLHFAWSDQHGHLAFANHPKDAPILHFGGPLTLRHHPSEKLCRGNDPGKTTLCLGTAGLGPGAFVTLNFDLVPRNVHPTVEVRFPARRRDQQPVTRKYVLKERC